MMTITQLSKLKRWLIVAVACGIVVMLVSIGFALSEGFEQKRVAKQLIDSEFRYSRTSGDRVYERVLTLSEDGKATIVQKTHTEMFFYYTYELKENADGYYLHMVLKSGSNSKGDAVDVNAGEKMYCRLELKDGKVLSVIDDHYTYKIVEKAKGE